MKKEYILTFCIAFLILATIVVIFLMILMPQQTTVTMNSVSEHSSIKKSDYTFKQTNVIAFDNLVREYSITDTEIQKFKNSNQYIAGNSDPFTVKESTDNGDGTSNNDTVDKITNSNGGVANPPSTNK